MRVLCVLESVSRADGGIFEAELALQRALAVLPGMDVRVVGLRDAHTEKDLDRWLPLKPRVAQVRGPLGIGYAPGISGLLDRDVDLAYGATLWKYPSWALLSWQKRMEKPVVLAPHGSLDVWALNNSRAKKRLAAWLFKDEQLRRATCFRALCVAEADAIREHGLTQRIEVVPNGVALPEFHGREPGAETHRPKRLLFLGRIHPKKGLAAALRAWADVKSKIGHAKRGEWQFVIAGWDQGGHEGELTRLCEELGLGVSQRNGKPGMRTEDDWQAGRGADVVFFGAAFGQEKEALLQSAEAFVLPSLSEGLPMSVLEAWSYGLPVVMTPECNLPEGFTRGAGIRIESPESLIRRKPKTREQVGQGIAEGFRTLFDMSAAERTAMGLLGRRLVEERFTWPKVAAQMRQIYESLL